MAPIRAFLRLPGRLRVLQQRRPAAIAIAMLLVMSSLNYVAAAKPAAAADPFGDIAKAGPRDVLAFDADGRIVAKPQRDPAKDRIGREIANSLQNGVSKGYFEVTPDFEVTLTPEGEQFAVESLEAESKGCMRVSNVTADWVGFHVKVEPACSDEELQERFNIDFDEQPEPETGAIDNRVLAAGMAPAQTTGPDANGWVNSDDFNCWAALAGTGVVLLAAFLAVVLLPWAGWFIFVIELNIAALGFFNTLIEAISNCTQLLSVRANTRRWVTYEPLLFPIAAIGLSGMRIKEVPGPSGGGDAYYVYSTVNCRFGYYSNYRYSYSTRTNVPTYVRWNCP